MEVVVVVLAAVAASTAITALVAVRRLQRVQQQSRGSENHDPLTGLPTRVGLTAQLDQILGESRRNSGRIAVCAVELWGFQHINETYGHEVGDLLVVAAADAIRGAASVDDVVVRYSGPSFVVACRDVPGPAQAQRRAERIRDAVSRTYEVGPDRVRLSTSIGVALTDHHLTTAEDVLHDATIALEEARQEGRDTIRVLDHSLRGRRGPTATEHRLRTAFDRGELGLLYFPVVSIRDGGIVGVEALLRWADPEHGLVPPRTFLRTLEETGLIVPVGNWVLSEAARQARRWNDHPGADLQVTVNISASQLAQPDFLEVLRSASNEHEDTAKGLCLEITEASLVRDPEQAWSMLRRAKQLGCALALDDFGTGASSLGHLRQYKVDNLKIDRTFVEGVDRGEDDAAIVEHVIGLARALHLRPIAEGIERREQVELLAAMGCEWGQGFYFSEPVPAEEVDALLAAGTALPKQPPSSGRSVSATALTPEA